MKKYDFTNKKIGKLTCIRQLKKEERPSQNHGNYWLCKCDCGNEVMVPVSYLTGNGNYIQTSCGCDRKKKAFLSTSYISLPEEYFDQFQNNFEKFLLIHKALVRTSGNNLTYYENNHEEYKKIIDYFWHDKQLEKIMDFWYNNKNKGQTFYDWAKPSLDHIIPSSKGGKNVLENFQFLTTFENLAKRDMTMEEWNNFKKDTNTTSDYFIENILNKEGD